MVEAFNNLPFLSFLVFPFAACAIMLAATCLSGNCRNCYASRVFAFLRIIEHSSTPKLDNRR
jgi:hypothetical protein